MIFSKLSIYGCGLLLLASSFERITAMDQVVYTVDLTHKIKFFFNETDLPSPDSLPDNADNLDDLRRLTQIYYIRTMAAAFAQSYKGVEVVYDSHKWLTMDTETDEGDLQYDFTDLIMDFDILVTFKDDAILPDKNAVLEAILSADAGLYTSNFVNMAKPRNIFQTANSTRISATIQSIGTPPPSTAPVYDDAPWVPSNITDYETPLPAPLEPTPSPTIEPSGVIIDIIVDESDESPDVTNNPPNSPVEDGAAGDLQQMIRGSSTIEKDEASISSASQSSSIIMALGVLAVGLFL